MDLDTLILTFNSLFVAFVFAALFAPILIGILYRSNQVVGHKKEKLGGGMEGDNSLFLKYHLDKNGTPNMGGILVWLIVPITSAVMLQINESDWLQIFNLAFLLFGFWGFLDVFFTNMIRNKPELKTLQENFTIRLVRFLLSVLISLLIIYLSWDKGLIEDIDLYFVTVSVTALMIPVLAIIGQLAVYSAEITDGLDGLMIGIFGISITGLGALLLIQEQYVYLPVIGIMIGVILVDLYFNINPARFYNGGPGAMPLGFATFFLALISNNLIPYFFITGLTWLIMSSSFIQIISMRFLKRRVFKMAPIHHHFQVMGWPETKIVMRFWLVTMILSIIGIYIGLVSIG